MYLDSIEGRQRYPIVGYFMNMINVAPGESRGFFDVTCRQVPSISGSPGIIVQLFESGTRRIEEL
jgi:hypothetical protein